MSESAGIDLGPLILALVVASAVAMLAKRFRIPYTSALVVAGAVAAYAFSVELALDRDVLFFVLLPPLIFEGALGINLKQVWDVRFYVLFFSVIGVVLTALTLGFGLQFVGVPLPVGLLLGAIVAATDPVGVITLFRDLGVPRRLRTIVEAESLFNDGTGVVLFGLMLSYYEAGTFHPTSALASFALVTLGGTAVGLALGALAFLVLRVIEDKLLETMITIILAYLSYAGAEAVHVSGIISVAMAGIIIGTYGKPLAMKPVTRVSLTNFWEIVAFTVNSLLFVLLGAEVRTVSSPTRFLGTALLAIGLAVAARAIMVYPFAWILKRTNHRLEKGWPHVLLWGGLRGAIPVALALSLPASMPERDLILTVVFGIVLFTLVIQGISFPWLLRRLRLVDDQTAPETGTHVVLEAARAAALHEAERVAEQQGLSKAAREGVVKDLEDRFAAD